MGSCAHQFALAQPDSICDMGSALLGVHYGAPATPLTCMAYLVAGDNCGNIPASFCVSEASYQDSSGACVPIDIQNQATIYGGAEACPLLAEAVFPGSARYGATTELAVSGSGFSPGATVSIVLGATSVSASSVSVLSPSRLSAVVTMPEGVGAADVVVAGAAGSADTLRSALTITAPSSEAPYDSTSLIVWFKPGRIALPAGSTEASAPFSAIEATGLTAALEAAHVQDVASCSAYCLTHPDAAAQLRDRTLLDIFVAHLADTAVVAACNALLADTADVVDAHPNWVFMPSATIPNNGGLSRSWWLRNTGQFGGIAGNDCNAINGWDYATGLEAQSDIAMLDTGADTSHIELAGRIVPTWTDPEVTDNVLDHVPHGTMVEGMLASKGDLWNRPSPITEVGMNWGAKVLSYKISNDRGAALESSINAALNAAAFGLARVINLSYGSVWGSYGQSREMEKYCREAFYRGKFVSVATGNFYRAPIAYPAAYYPYVYAIGASDFFGHEWNNDAIDWSLYVHGNPTGTGTGTNDGPHLWLLAPGGLFIETIIPSWVGSYCLVDPNAPGTPNVFHTYGFGGTSAAAPVASGAASLVQILAPTMSGEDIGWVLAKSCKPIPNLAPEHQGYGRLDLAGALSIVKRGTLVQHVVTAGGVVTAQTGGFATQNYTWNGIPSGTYSATRYVVRKAVSFPAAYASHPQCWPTIIASLGSLTLPAALYDSSLAGAGLPGNVDVHRWDASVDTVNVSNTQATLQTSVWKLSSAAGTYWWPCDTAHVQMALTAVGIPASALSVGSGNAGATPRFAINGNPARDAAILDFELERATKVKVSVYDLAGRLAAVPVSGDLPAGNTHLRWPLLGRNGDKLAPGIYLVKSNLSVDSGSRRLVIIR